MIPSLVSLIRVKYDAVVKCSLNIIFVWPPMKSSAVPEETVAQEFDAALCRAGGAHCMGGWG